jgi:hypothetical protein
MLKIWNGWKNECDDEFVSFPFALFLPYPRFLTLSTCNSHFLLRKYSHWHRDSPSRSLIPTLDSYSLIPTLDVFRCLPYSCILTFYHHTTAPSQTNLLKTQNTGCKHATNTFFLNIFFSNNHQITGTRKIILVFACVPVSLFVSQCKRHILLLLKVYLLTKLVVVFRYQSWTPTRSRVRPGLQRAAL